MESKGIFFEGTLHQVMDFKQKLAAFGVDETDVAFIIERPQCSHGPEKLNAVHIGEIYGVIVVRLVCSSCREIELKLSHIQLVNVVSS